MSVLFAAAAKLEAAPPTAPGNLRASMTFPLASPASGSDAFHVYLFEWEDRSNNEQGFELSARVGTVAPFSSLRPIASNSTLVIFRLNAFPGGTVLEFRLRAYRGREFSAFSNVAQVTIPANPDFDAPTGLAVTNGPRDLTRLTWIDNSEQEDYFVIETKLQSAPDTAWEVVAFPLFNTRQFDLFEDLDPGKTYDFRLRGLRLGPSTESDPELVYSAATTATHTIPPLSNSPKHLNGIAVDEDTIRLNWFDESDKEQGYEVQLKQGESPFAFLAYTAANGTSFTENTPPSTTVTWRVLAAYQDSGDTILTSPASNEVTITTPFHAPTTLTAVSTPETNVVTLTWDDRSRVETGYEVYGRLAGTTGDFALLKTVDQANATTTTITNLPFGVAVEFVVVAYFEAEDDEGETIFIRSDSSPSAVASSQNAITSPLQALVAASSSFVYQVTTTSSIPRISLNVEGLPPGLIFNPANGQISGTAATSGVFPVTLRATFADGTTAQATLTLTLRSPSTPAPPLAIPLGDRSIPPSSPLSIPLSSLFKDPDTESAVRLTTTIGNIDVILYPSATPLTVANFLSYVNAGDYNGVAFHRSVPGFVIQGGAYKPVEEPDKFQSIVKRPSPLNEPGISNLERTVAMAKLGDNPNSATSEFFFNLANNAGNLDSQNGGFTAFARVSNASWNVVESMAQKPASPYAYFLDDVSTEAVSYTLVPSNPTFPWPMNPQPGDDLYPAAPAQMQSSRTIVIQNAVQLLDPLSYAVTNNTNPSGVSAVIDGDNLVLQGPLAGAESEITVTATDLDGTSTPQTFVVRILDDYAPPAITTPPASASLRLGGPLSLSVAVTGAPPLSYQWRKGSVELPGQTGAVLSLNNSSYGDAGDYSVVVSNQRGSVTSAAATVTITGPPVITVPPAPLARGYGLSATFSVTVAGPGPFRYQWFQGTRSVALTATSTSPSNTFTIPSVAISHAGDYRVVVSNAQGRVANVPVRLTILPTDLDGDGTPDQRDTDGDGFDDGVEQAFGGDPLSNRRRPTTVFAARSSGASTLENLLMRRVQGTPDPSPFVHSLDSTTKSLPPFWLAAQELSNSQFASILQVAYELALIQIGSGDRPKVTFRGEDVCLLPVYASTDPGGLKVNEVGFDPNGGFFVPSTVANHPVRGVSWYGAYLSSVVMNLIGNYTGKTESNDWVFNSGPDGYFVPSDAEWEWAANSGIADQLYPTGATVSTKLANFATTAGTRPVTSYPGNAFGILNLAGNVAEWVSDPSDLSAEAFNRGGSWLDAELALRNNQRGSLARSSLTQPTGIRLALKDDRPPSFTTPPAHRLVSLSDPLTFVATATGAPKLTGQWFKNGAILKGQTRPVLSFPNPKLSDAGTYKVTLTNPLGTTTSQDVQAAVVGLPRTPQTTTTATGIPITLRIPYAGQGLSFQWKKDGTDIFDGLTYDILSPTTPQGTATLTVIAPTVADWGRYTCTISSSASPAPAPLEVAFELNVLAEPAFGPVSAPVTLLTSTYQYDLPFDTHQLRAPSTFSASGLPAGLTLNRTTGRISGRPRTPGVYSILATATNATGTTTIRFPLVVQTLQGSFAALVARDPETNSNLGGDVVINTTASGAYSGTLRLGGLTYRFSGTLSASVNSAANATVGNATLLKQIPRPGLEPVELSLTLSPTSNLVTGTLRKVVTPAPVPLPAAAAVNGWRQIFSTAAQPTARLGRHHFALDLPGSLDGQANVPQGLGYGVIQIGSNGIASVTGKLSDGSDFSSAAPLGPSGQVLVFRSLYGNSGSLAGTLSVAADPIHIVSGAPTWRKLLTPAARLYPNGFGLDPGPISLTAFGSLYTPPAAGQFVMGLPAVVAPATSEFLRLLFAEGGVETPEILLDVPTIELRPPATVVMPPSGTNNPASATLRIIPSTGVFSGKFTLTDSAGVRTQTYQGQIVRGQDGKQRGYGYFILAQPPEGTQTLRTSPQKSGAVVLEEKP